MKKIILILVASLFTLFYSYMIHTTGMPKRIISTVLMVEGSSGIVVYSDNNRALVLTAYHTIDDVFENASCCGCDYKVDVTDKRERQVGLKLKVNPKNYYVSYIDVDEKSDLAIIEIKVDRKLPSARIGRRFELGEDIYIASNPNNKFQSLKKGIVSSEFRVSLGTPVMEVDAGIIFGSSGGGIFNMNGEVIGIVRSVEMIETEGCFDKINEDTGKIEEECVNIPLPFMGYALHPLLIREFLLNSVFSKDFDYLK